MRFHGNHSSLRIKTPPFCRCFNLVHSVLVFGSEGPVKISLQMHPIASVATTNVPLVKVQIPEWQNKNTALFLSWNFTCAICSVSIGFANIYAIKLDDNSLRVLVTLVVPHRRDEVTDTFSVNCTINLDLSVSLMPSEGPSFWFQPHLYLHLQIFSN